MIDLYINTAFINYKNVNLTIISHPHRKHLTLDYQVSVSKLINEVTANSKFKKNVTHFTPFERDYDFNFLDGDKASHLDKDSYRNLGEYIYKTISIR